MEREERELLAKGWELPGTGEKPLQVRPCWPEEAPGLLQLVQLPSAGGPGALWPAVVADLRGIDQETLIGLCASEPGGKCAAICFAARTGRRFVVQSALAEGRGSDVEIALLAEVARRVAQYGNPRLIAIVSAVSAAGLKADGGRELRRDGVTGCVTLRLDMAAAIGATQPELWKKVARRNPAADIETWVRTHAYHLVVAAMLRKPRDHASAIAEYAEAMDWPGPASIAHVASGMRSQAENETEAGALIRRAMWLTASTGLGASDNRPALSSKDGE
jgi:hypothetical protein